MGVKLSCKVSRVRRRDLREVGPAPPPSAPRIRELCSLELEVLKVVRHRSG